MKAACPARPDASAWGRDGAEIQVAPARLAAWALPDASVLRVASAALPVAWEPLSDARRMRRDASRLALRE